MSDLIKRQDVIDFLKLTRDSEYKKSMSAEVKHKSVTRSKHDEHVAFCDYLIEYVKQVPTHTTQSNTLGALDCVSRQDAIDAVKEYFMFSPREGRECAKAIERVPSVHPDVIRCKDCKWRINQDESTEWLPCMEIVTPSDFYCGSAKLREE